MPIYKMDGKKDGKQKYRVRINYQDNLGKPRQIDRVTVGLEEAKALERELKQSIKEEPTHKSLTLRQLYEEYIQAKKFEVRETSLDKSIRILEYHVLPILGDAKIHKLNTPILQKWKLAIEGKDLALTSRQNIFGEFRALLNYAVRMEYIPQNPLPKVGNFKSAITLKEEMDFYTPEEFKAFIGAARTCAMVAERREDMSEWHYYMFFMIAFYTGLRKGEIHGLH